MTCKDCLHYDVCRNNTETTAYYLYSPHTGEYFDEHNGCIYFTPKSEWMHIPCKIGDVVWYIDEIWRWDVNTDQTTSCKQVISGERVKYLTDDDSKVFDCPLYCPNMTCYRSVLNGFHHPVNEEDIAEKEKRSVAAWMRKYIKLF